jgi:hypothetical protein
LKEKQKQYDKVEKEYFVIEHDFQDKRNKENEEIKKLEYEVKEYEKIYEIYVNQNLAEVEDYNEIKDLEEKVFKLLNIIKIRKHKRKYFEKNI